MSNMDFPELKAPGQRPVVNSIFDFSDQALGGLRLYLEQNPPAIPITSILGFSSFVARANRVTTFENTSSGSYTNLVTTGPQLTGLQDGTWLFIYGAQMKSTVSGQPVFMSVQVNSTTASDDDAAATYLGELSACTAASLQTLANSGNSTVTCKYKAYSGSPTTGGFGVRFLIGIKVSNA